MRAFLFLNTMVIKVANLKNDQTGVLISAGPAVMAALQDHASGAAISGGGISLAYAGTPGSWNGLFPSDVGVTLAQVIDVILTIDGGSNLSRGRIRIPCQVEERQAA